MKIYMYNTALQNINTMKPKITQKQVKEILKKRFENSAKAINVYRIEHIHEIETNTHYYSFSLECRMNNNTIERHSLLTNIKLEEVSI